MYEATVYGDTTFTEFTDGFLAEHVKSVSVCDTEMVSKERQVKDFLNLEINEEQNLSVQLFRLSFCNCFSCVLTVRIFVLFELSVC